MSHGTSGLSQLAFPCAVQKERLFAWSREDSDGHFLPRPFWGSWELEEPQHQSSGHLLTGSSPSPMAL